MNKFEKLRIWNLLAIVVIILTASSCFFGKKKDSATVGAKGWVLNNKTSATTGWNYSDPNQGGFQPGSAKDQKTAPGMVFIEGGTFTMGKSDEDVILAQDKNKRRVTINSFYMDEYEVTNRAWREYIYWLKMVYGQSNPSIISKAMPDSLCWRQALSYNEPMLQNYFTHASFSFYPVVGVTWEQCVEYCKWRTDRVNELVMAKNGIIKMPDYSAAGKGGSEMSDVYTTDKYLSDPTYDNKGDKPILDAWGAPRKVTSSDGILFPSYRLPTEAEWEYAAYAILNVKGQNTYEEKRMYPWKGHYLRTPPTRKNKRGVAEFKANFVMGRGDMMGQAGALNDGALYTAPVDSYQPNDFGLYNMAGNVNEWVMDVYRPLNSVEEGEYSPYRGNQFTKNEVGTDGKVVFDEFSRKKETIEIDTLADGTPVPQDYSNYNDGDSKSSINPEDWKKRTGEGEKSTDLMYNGDKDTPEGVLNAVLTNTVRVYKGGSWNDRVYWLNPATRRYLEQNKSSAEIGFRCAMDRVGAASTQKGIYEKK